MATNIPATKKGFGFLVLFSLPFAAVGVGSALWLGSTILAHWKMQSWEETPARIVRAKLETNSDSDGGTTYKATAEYTYRYRGQHYTGNRVSIHSGSDNIGSFQQDVHRQLSEHQKSDRSFRCYVNPAQPTEAILFRDLRWEMAGFQMLFATVFSAAGFGMLAFALIGYRKARGDSALAALHPDEPWLCKKQWADGKITSAAKTSMLVLLVFAFFWNLISAPTLFAFRHEIFDKGNRWALLMLLFPVVGAILILAAIVSVLRWRKFGQSVFEMATVPGVVGGQLAGVIRTSAKVEPEEGFRLVLNCVQRVTTRRGKESHTTESILWQDEQIIARDLLQNDPERSAIPVLFQVPYDCRPTDEAIANNQTIWRLAVSASTPGLDYSTSFDVPVFRTPESDPNFIVDSSLIAEYVAPENPDRDLREAGVIKTESPTGEGYRLVFPMARAPGMAAVLTVMGLVFGAIPIVVYRLEAGFSFTTVLFGVAFGLAGLFFLAIAVDSWFYRSVVDVSASGLTVKGGWLGFGGEQRIEANEIEKIVPKSRMSSGQGQGQKMYYDIDIVCATGKKVTAGKRIPGKRLAEAVIRQIERAMGRI